MVSHSSSTRSFVKVEAPVIGSETPGKALTLGRDVSVLFFILFLVSGFFRLDQVNELEDCKQLRRALQKC